jgi:hypothetical protein
MSCRMICKDKLREVIKMVNSINPSYEQMKWEEDESPSGLFRIVFVIMILSIFIIGIFLIYEGTVDLDELLSGPDDIGGSQPPGLHAGPDDIEGLEPPG